MSFIVQPVGLKAISVLLILELKNRNGSLRMCYDAISVKEKIGRKLLFDKCALVAKKLSNNSGTTKVDGLHSKPMFKI